MGGDLDWKSNTNTTENSCKIAQCDCLTFWEVYQQVAMQRLSNLKDAKQNLYRLEEGYEARARRIAAAYAKIFLEKEINGNVNLKGRYYWMGLGAFASKTVANVFDHWGSQTGYSAPIIVNTIKEPIDLFALGNLWLFMDIAPWHYAWSASSKTFDSCRTQRNISKFTHIKKEVMSLPWSSCLPEIKYLGSTEQIKDAFALLPQIEKIFLGERTEKGKYNAAKRYLFDHLIFIAVQEQFNILQTVVWNKASAQWGAEKQRSWYMGWAMPDATLVLSSDYDVDEVKEGWFSSSDKAKRASELPEEVYISPFSDTKAENYDSRMIWIKKAAEKYHRLMLDDKGRAFLHQELKTITGWSQSKANFLFGIHPSSNERKNNDFFNKSFNMKNYLSLIFGFSICCLLLACTPNTKSKGNEIMPPQSAILHFGQQGLKDFIQYSNAPIDRQPAGMNFLSLDWRPPKLGQVKIVTEQSNFEIDNVISVMGTQIARMGNDGVLIMDVTASLHANEYTTREDAYQAYVKLMKQMSEKNWKQYFLPYSERIDKQDNLKYMSQNMGAVIDPSYILSFKEWQEMMDLTNGHMYFNLYNSNINLAISLSKTYKDDKKEQYMLRYSFEHFRYTGFNAISNSDEMTAEQLKQAFLDERRDNEKDRKFKEEKIKLEGYHIDDSYVDPDVWQYMK